MRRINLFYRVSRRNFALFIYLISLFFTTVAYLWGIFLKLILLTLKTNISLMSELRESIEGIVDPKSSINTNEFSLAYSSRNIKRAEADFAYRQNNWNLARKKYGEAEAFSDVIIERFGFDKLPFRFIGSSFTKSIGHIAIGIGSRARLALLAESKEFNYIIISGGSSNSFYLSKWGKYFPIIDSSSLGAISVNKLLWPIFETVETLKIGGQMLDLYSAHNELCIKWAGNENRPLLSTSDEELEIGRDFLIKNHIDPDAWFVTLHVRDNFFDKPGYGRNADILTYLPAIKEIISKGGVVIRIGDSNSKKLPKMKGYLDATGNISKNGKLDIFLLSKCRFMIGTLSGPLIVPQTFGVPVLSTNAPDFFKNILLPNSLVIPKLIRDSTGRLLTFSEMYNATELWTDSYLPSSNKSSFSWVDNSQEDILIGVSEMIEGKNFQPTEIQKSFVSRFRENKTTTLTPVSQNFLNKYESLFTSL